MNFRIDKYGMKYWRNTKNIVHRLDGPAVICPNGKQYWIRHGKKHRLEGPAIIYSGLEDFKEWFWLGKPYTEKGHIFLSNTSFFTRRIKI